MIDLAAAAVRKAREGAAAQDAFFAENAARIAACAVALARAFDAGARLFTVGNGGSSCDAAHAAVEFAHPVLEKRRAIPAMALSSDAPLITALGNDQDFAVAFAHQVRLHARSGDVVLGLSTSGK
ncbi:MAG TPA: SIS domain-containing protein, partial [Byssovorax sp.]